MLFKYGVALGGFSAIVVACSMLGLLCVVFWLCVICDVISLMVGWLLFVIAVVGFG